MEDNPYEIIPHQILTDLRDEVEALKKKLMEPDNMAKELLVEMGALKDAVHEMHAVFKQAVDLTKAESPTQRLATLVQQNETIAHGMLAISEKMDQLLGAGHKMPIRQQSAPQMTSGMAQHHMGMPPMRGAPARAAPMPTMDMPDMSSGMAPPPPPTGKPKKKGLFG